jgi:hypothetical protein
MIGFHIDPQEPDAVELFEQSLENLVQFVAANLSRKGLVASHARIRRVLLADELQKAQLIEEAEEE